MNWWKREESIKCELIIELRNKLASSDTNGKVKKLIDYIENDSLCAMPIEMFFNEDGSHITKNKYGKLLFQTLCEELRTKFLSQEKANNIIQQ